MWERIARPDVATSRMDVQTAVGVLDAQYPVNVGQDFQQLRHLPKNDWELAAVNFHFQIWVYLPMKH